MKSENGQMFARAMNLSNKQSDPMKKVKGDLLQLAQDGQFDVIIHGCNCFCDMGAGIAKTIRSTFPQAYKADCATTVGDQEKLGTITQAIVSVGKHRFTIVNGYTQFHWKGKGVLVDYEAIRNVFRAVKELFAGKRIGYPMIGAGLARGDWRVISAIIDEQLDGEDHTVVEYCAPPCVKKRPLPNDDTAKSAVLDQLVAWIRAQGGFVHKAIHLSNTRELRVVEQVPRDTLLMKLPQKSVVISRRFLPSDCPIVRVEVDPERLEDIILALYLTSNRKEIQPYLNSLPDASSFSTFPTRWPLKRLTKLLSGSPILKALRNEKQVLQKDYNLVVDALSRSSKTGIDRVKIPSFEVFRDAMTYVESRAFCLDGMVDERGVALPAMVPLLDMCDHRRGQNGERKNLAYIFQEGNVFVKSVRDLQAGETLRITYGARSNAHLLLKYGFCLADNVEPDGSSNDLFEFEPIAGREGACVQLQTGPKAYTFGKFVKALEYFYPATREEGVSDDSELRNKNDLEAFLNECDEEGGNDVDLHESSVEGADDRNVADHRENMQVEIDALSRFEARLLEVARGYCMSGTEVSMSKAVPAPTPKFYAALLIHSELRTIWFFLLAIRGIKKSLHKTSDPEAFDTPGSMIDLHPDDLKMINEQVQELVDAYVRIRHPSFARIEQSLLPC